MISPPRPIPWADRDGERAVVAAISDAHLARDRWSRAAAWRRVDAAIERAIRGVAPDYRREALRDWREAGRRDALGRRLRRRRAAG